MWLNDNYETKRALQFGSNLLITLVMEVMSALLCLMLVNRNGTILENVKQKAGKTLAFCFLGVFAVTVVVSRSPHR